MLKALKLTFIFSRKVEFPVWTSFLSSQLEKNGRKTGFAQLSRRQILAELVFCPDWKKTSGEKSSQANQAEQNVNELLQVYLTSLDATKQTLDTQPLQSKCGRATQHQTKKPLKVRNPVKKWRQPLILLHRTIPSWILSSLCITEDKQPEKRLFT